VTYRVHDLSEQARSLIEESPLAVGAVAVAVGTAIGAALPSTSTERRVLRPATNRAIEDGRAEGHRGARPGGTAHERDDVWPWSVDRLDRINATESLFGWHRCIAGEQLESFQHYQHGQPEPSQLRDRFW
jgi:hypothetical protein